MNGRGLRVACQTLVALWMVTALGWFAVRAESGVPLEPPALTARVVPRAEPPPPEAVQPEPPPEPVSEPSPEPPPEDPPTEVAEGEETAPEEAPQPTHVASADLRRGGELLDGAGDFPVLSCAYDSFASFRDYAHAMVSLGAHFVVVRNRQILGGIDVENGHVTETSSLAGGYSPRARDYTDEPELAHLALAARARFGRGAVVMMLVPRSIDAGLFGGIARALVKRGESHEDYREIRGRYERSTDGRLRLRIDSGVRTDGAKAPLELLFDLGDIAHLGRAARGSA